MRMRIQHGFTLIEILTVLSVFVLVLISVSALALQSSRLFGETSGHIESHQSQMLALKRMEREIREAMTIAPMPDVPESNYVDIVMPQKSADGRFLLNKVTIVKQLHDDNGNPVLDPITNQPKTLTYDQLVLQKEHKRVRFYLGENPRTGNNDTIFRVEVSEDGTTLLTTPRIIISGVASNPKIFAFSSAEATTGTINARLITIRLTSPTQEHTRQGIKTVNDILSTQFRMRNLHTAT